MTQKNQPTRRQFISKAAAGAAIIAAAPMGFTASRTSDEVIVGEGEYKFRVRHDWPMLPDKYNWQTTHNVAVDKAGKSLRFAEAGAGLLHFAQERMGLQTSFEALVDERRRARAAGAATSKAGGAA